jgi:hypothetical protein
LLRKPEKLNKQSQARGAGCSHAAILAWQYPGNAEYYRAVLAKEGIICLENLPTIFQTLTGLPR